MSRHPRFKVQTRYWLPTFTRLSHKSSQNKSTLLNKQYHGNIQLVGGLSHEH